MHDESDDVGGGACRANHKTTGCGTDLTRAGVRHCLDTVPFMGDAITDAATKITNGIASHP